MVIFYILHNAVSSAATAGACGQAHVKQCVRCAGVFSCSWSDVIDTKPVPLALCRTICFVHLTCSLG